MTGDILQRDAVAKPHVNSFLFPQSIQFLQRLTYNVPVFCAGASIDELISFLTHRV